LSLRESAAQRPFSGRTYRILTDRASVWDTYFLFRFHGEVPPASVDLPVDFWDFEDEPKLGPAVLYQRELPAELDPLVYFHGNESGALVVQDQVDLEYSTVLPMADREFWSLARTTAGQPWTRRIDEIVQKLRTQSVSNILAFHHALEMKISSLEHPLRSVLIGDVDVDPDATGAAIAAIILDGVGAYSYHLAELERLEDVSGITQEDVLRISRRALKEGHGIDARLTPGSTSPTRSQSSEPANSRGADELEQEAAYRALVYGFADTVWDFGGLAEWLSARALVEVDGNAVEIILLAARLANEDRDQTILKILERLLDEGPLLAGPEVATPLFARPGLRSTPFFEIVERKAQPAGDYLLSAGYPMLQSASTAVEEVHPRWALFDSE